MYMEHIAASTYVQISREELEDWLNDIGFRGKWDRDSRFAGVYLLKLSDTVAVKLSSTIGSADDAMGVGKASMQLALVSLVTGRVVNKKAQGQSHFARTKGWKKNWAEGIETMRRAYNTAADFYDVVAEIADRDKYQQDMLSLIESVPGWDSNNFFINLHQKVSRGGVVMPADKREIQKGLAAPVRQQPAKVSPSGVQQGPQEVTEQQIQALRGLWSRANRSQPYDERGEQNKKWVMDFAKSIAEQLKAGRRLSPAQITTVQRNLDQWKVEMNGDPASKLFS
jgi:hypothetical protein